jgi:uncharacterized protein (DUF362 family)
MGNRRDFLKNAATGAMILGAQSKLGLAGILDQHAETSKSKVVVARDAQLHGAGTQLDEQRVLDLLDSAITAYTGHNHPVETWKRIVPMGKVIGLKVNCAGGKGISTHLALTLAICERLQQAGVKPGNILVWDQANEALESGGYTINKDPSRIRCYGSDVAGYEDRIETNGVVRVRLSKILTRECEMVMNLPILKDHACSGLTFAMKNMYGVVKMEDVGPMHVGNCNPAIADLHCIPAIRDKVRFVIGDAISALYEGGPLFRPEHIWHPNALIVGQDRVAVDQTAWGILERKRAEVGLPTLEAAGREPRYIARSADAAHHLGVNDPQRISLMEI